MMRRLLLAATAGVALAVAIPWLWRLAKRSVNTQVHRVNQ